MDRRRIYGYAVFALAIIVVIGFIIAMAIVEYGNPPVMWSIIAIVIVLDFIFAYYILNSERYTYIKMCWIFVVLAFPLIGVLIFIIFGTTPFKRKQWGEYNKNQRKFLHYEKFYSKNLLKLNSDDLNIFNFPKNNSFRPIYKWNELRIIKDNQDLYKESIRLIRSAKKFIHIQMYIVCKGYWLNTLISELEAKVKEGVKVRFIYDWVGCTAGRLPKKIVKQMKEAGISLAIFNPHGINMFKGSTNYRSHRKAIIIDNKKALFGGSNIANEYLSINPNFELFKDLNFIVSGEVVNTLNLLFCQDYCNLSSIKKDSKEYNDVYNKLGEILIPKKANKEMYAQVVESSPEYNGKTIKNQLINMIIKAKKSIHIICPYFFPTEDILEALTIAGQSGTKISIMLPGKVDDKLYVKILNRSYYKRLLEAKIKVYEFNGFIHSKLMVVDGEYVFTGSYNLDYRSLWINFENAILFKNTKLAQQLIEDFDTYTERSFKITRKFANTCISRWNKIQISLKNIYYPLL